MLDTSIYARLARSKSQRDGIGFTYQTMCREEVLQLRVMGHALGRTDMAAVAGDRASLLGR